jgi:hypothetical protein
MIPRVAPRFPVPGQALKVPPIELPSTLRPLTIVTLKNQTLSPVAQTFIDGDRKMASACSGEVDAGSPTRTCANQKNLERVPIPQERNKL